MAKNSSNNLTFLLELEIQHKDFLAQIRHWDNIKVAFDEGFVWVKEITEQQFNSIEVKSIPFKKTFYLQDNLLFFVGSQLPVKKMNTSLLWSSIKYAFPVTLPPINYNFFGIEEKLAISIIKSDIETESNLMIVSEEDLKEYLNTCPKNRLVNLSWVVLNGKAVICGTPFLPIKGDTFWQKNNSFFPSGYNLEFPLLNDLLNENIDTSNENIIIWQKSGNYVLVPKIKFKQLSISSFRLTLSN